MWHLYVVRSEEREALQQLLGEAGVGTLIHYPIPPHKQEAYARLGIPAYAFPVASRMADEALSLPIGPQMRKEEQRVVIECLRRDLIG